MNESESPTLATTIVACLMAFVIYCVISFGLSALLAYFLVKFLCLHITVTKLALLIWLARLLFNVNIVNNVRK